VAPGGEIVDEIRMPEGLDVFACMLGGQEGRTLVMGAAPDFLQHNRVGATDAVPLTTTVDVPHAGLP
jgi:sugar lactone lactonase YvrE